MSASYERRTPVVLWPIVGLWRVITWIAGMIGILLTLTIGAVLMFVGWFLTMTVVGAILGIPMFVIGLMLFVRGLY